MGRDWITEQATKAF